MSSTDPLLPPSNDGPPPGPSVPAESFPLDEGPLEVLPAGPEEPPPPPKPPHPNFWWALLWCLGCILLVNGTLIAILIAELLVVTVATGKMPITPGHGGGPAVMETVGRLMAPAMLGAEAVLALVTWLVIRMIVGADWKRRLAFRPPGAVAVVLALLGIPGMLLFPSLVADLASRVLPTFNNSQETLKLVEQVPAWFAVVAIGLGPAVAEELFCRGFLGRGLVGHYGFVGGVVLTSVCFGMLHLDPPQVVGTFVLGLWLHFVYLTSRSLPLSMTLHFINNASAVLLARFVGQQGAAAEETAWYVYAAAAFLTAAVAWAFYDGRPRLVAVDPGADPWRPAYPGVQLPPPGSGTGLARRGPRALCWLAVLAGLAAFVAAFALAVVRGEAGL